MSVSNPSVTIPITDDMIDRAVASLLRVGDYDEEGGPCGTTTAVNVRKMVRDEVQRRIDREICKAIEAATKQAVESRVDEILADGFPVFGPMGEKKETRTLRQLVGEAVFKRDSYGEGLESRARKAMANCVESIVRDHVKTLDKDIRESMKAAASEALAKWMASTLGMRG